MRGGKYCCNDDRKAYEDYYLNQCGHGMPVFYGTRMHRGHGIGSIFSGLFRSIFTVLQRVAPVIGKKALQTGIDIASDVAAGQSLKRIYEKSSDRRIERRYKFIHSYGQHSVALWFSKETQAFEEA